MLTAAELVQARADLEAELPDVVTVWRDTGEDTTDPDTLAEVDVWEPLAVDVAAAVVPQPRDAQQRESGDEPVFLRTFHVTLPAATPVEVGDYVEVTASEDDRSQGRILTVRDITHGSVSLSRRTVCQDNLTRPTFVYEESS